MPVFFFIEDVSIKLKHKNILKKWLKTIVEAEHKQTGTINYIFCSDAYLLNLNQTYLKHDTLTDIITFPYNEAQDLIISGDIYISTERVSENAVVFDTSFENELNRVMAHGMLHLIGYGDKTKAENKLMRQKEDFCLQIRASL